MPSLVLRSNVLRSTRRLTPFESSLAKSPGNTYDQDRRGGWHWKPGIMRAVVQRVRSASVEVDGEVVSAIGPGLLCLVGLHRDDTDKDAEYICRKILSSRLFPNAEKAWDFSVTAANREVLLVSQFTLFARLAKNKPDFSRAMAPQAAREFYDKFVGRVRESYVPERVKDGVFGAMMNVRLENDGPVTVVLDSNDRE